MTIGRVETDSALSSFWSIAGSPSPSTGSGSQVPKYDSRRTRAERRWSMAMRVARAAR
jgi:hypothetical protein